MTLKTSRAAFLVLQLVSSVALGATSALAAEIVVAHSAGANGQAVDALLKEFSAETGIKATGVTLSDTDAGAKMQLAARTGNAPYDVVLGMSRDVFTLTASSGIYAVIDTAKWKSPTLSAMQEAGLLGKDFAVSQDTAAVLVYGAKLADHPPKTWRDFFDTKAFPGNRGMASGGLGVPINFEYALIAAGVAPDKLYPLDYGKALAKIRDISRDMVLWDNAPKAIQDLVNGDTAMAWSFAPAALGALTSGQNIHIAAPPGTAVIRGVGVVMKKGPDGVDIGQTFMEWWYRPENQKKYTEFTNFGIVVPSAEVLKLFSPASSQYLPFSGEHPKNYRLLSYDYYTSEADMGQSNLSVALEKWNQFRAR